MGGQRTPLYWPGSPGLRTTELRRQRSGALDQCRYKPTEPADERSKAQLLVCDLFLPTHSLRTPKLATLVLLASILQTVHQIRLVARLSKVFAANCGMEKTLMRAGKP